MPRAARVCPTPGCPNYMPCSAHARPGPRQRGYDTGHDRLRKQWAVKVAANLVDCWRCGEHIEPGEPWDLGHDDGDRTQYCGPEHAYRCNRSAAGRMSHE